MVRIRYARLCRVGGVIGAATLVFTGCRDSPRSSAAEVPDQVCASKVNNAGSGQFSVVAEYGDLDDGVQAAAGIALAAGKVFVFDMAAGQILVLSEDLQKLGVIGRPGSGPGEFNKFSTSTSAPQWMASSGDSLLVYDGDRVHLLNTEGRLLSYVDLEGISPISTRIAHKDGAWIFGRGITSPYIPPSRPDSPVFQLASVAGRMNIEFTLPLPTPPMDQGRPFITPGHARPQFDARDGCFVVNDGGTGRLYVGSSAGVDTIRFEPAKWMVYRPDPGDSVLFRRFGLKEWPESKAPARYKGLIIDPEWNVWLRPAEDRVAGTPLEVAIVSIPSGNVRYDTVAAFPTVFASETTYFGVTTDSLGVQCIVRVERIPGEIKADRLR